MALWKKEFAVVFMRYGSHLIYWAMVVAVCTLFQWICGNKGI